MYSQTEGQNYQQREPGNVQNRYCDFGLARFNCGLRTTATSIPLQCRIKLCLAVY